MWMCDDGVFECKLGINVWEKNRKYSTYFVRYNSHHVVKTSIKLLTSLLMTSESLIAPYIHSLNFRAKRRMPYWVVDTHFVLLLYCFK